MHHEWSDWSPNSGCHVWQCAVFERRIFAGLLCLKYSLDCSFLSLRELKVLYKLMSELSSHIPESSRLSPPNKCKPLCCTVNAMLLGSKAHCLLCSAGWPSRSLRLRISQMCSRFQRQCIWSHCCCHPVSAGSLDTCPPAVWHWFGCLEAQTLSSDVRARMTYALDKHA